MEEKDFELLIMLDKTKNITHAAEKLYISQSSLSKRIATIEKELGVQLLVRTRTGILFTPSGEEVLKTAETVTEQLQRMREKNCLVKAHPDRPFKGGDFVKLRNL
ncbi:LysR family transcriptional regulator [Secundilactobacillus silagei]|uniref:LysR family transcriptional regulator n=1 Tax=Secundilactobacillus silagei TaxID=1293415 RepID=UPI000AE388AD|nr:LysR family transcriptional regulator [Secundilactobacillus silagei]